MQHKFLSYQYRKTRAEKKTLDFTWFDEKHVKVNKQEEVTVQEEANPELPQPAKKRSMFWFW
jgi:phage terminase large subunit-like protein